MSVAFEATGGAVRLDAQVMGAVRDALVHVVRNAVAHGIEPAAERLRRGKAATGRIALQVERRGGRVAFACRDDGAGIDLAAVREAAVRKGLLRPEAAAALDVRGATELLLAGRGLSTSRGVNDVAGRGVGLDAARAVAARLEGRLELASSPGHGTVVELTVPVSLSAISALLVESAGATLAIPLDAVRETFFLPRAGVVRAGAGLAVSHGGMVLPFAELAAALGRPAGAGRRGHLGAVVVESGGRRAALGADRLLGVADVVLRPLPPFVEADAVVAGVSIDAHGVPQLVLDAAGLVAAAARAAGPEAQAAPRRPPVLVIDDSLTTRMLEQSILEAAGYEVALASSAEEALEKARAQRYGLFVVDVEMPGMDGFEFVRTTRADPQLSSVPAILVTSRSAAEDRRRGAEVGASAYVVKGEFDQARLLQHVAELIA